MPFLRSLTVFILSLIFTFSIFIAITSYNIGNLIQKESIKNFIKSESTKYLNQECQNQCSQYEDYKDACIQLCLTELINQTEISVNKVVDDIYQQKFFDMTLDEVSLFLSQYILFAIIGIFSGILILIASKTPFLSLGKNIISVSISLFISSIAPQFMLASINLPFNLGKSIKDYFFPSFNQLIYYGIILLIIGIILVIVNYVIKKKKK